MGWEGSVIDRRSFIKSILATAALNYVPEVVDKLLEDSNDLSDEQFVTYVTISFRLYVHNPSKCFYIDNFS